MTGGAPVKRAGVAQDQLRVESTNDVRVGDAAHALHERGGAQVDTALARGLPYAGEGAGHELLEAGGDLALLPEIVLEPLHPLEVRHDDPTRVAEDIGDHGDAAFAKDRVALRSRGPVGALGDDVGPDALGIALVDDGADGGGDEDVARLLEEGCPRDDVRTWKAYDAAALRHVGL